MAEKRVPIRTCIACRREFGKQELLRIVKNKDGVFSIDKTGKADGRGAYICASADCFKKLAKAKLLDKAFKTSVPENIYRGIEEEALENAK